MFSFTLNDSTAVETNKLLSFLMLMKDNEIDFIEIYMDYGEEEVILKSIENIRKEGE